MRISKKIIMEMENIVNVDKLKKTSGEIDNVSKKIGSDMKNLKTDLTKTLGDEKEADSFMNNFIGNKENVNETDVNNGWDCDNISENDITEYGYRKISSVFGKPVNVQSACWGGLRAWALLGDDCGSDGLYIIDNFEEEGGTFKLIRRQYVNYDEFGDVDYSAPDEDNKEDIFTAIGIEKENNCYNQFKEYSITYTEIDGDINDLITKAMNLKKLGLSGVDKTIGWSYGGLTNESLIRKHLKKLLK